MAIGVENREKELVISMPLHHDIPSLIEHFRKLADKLEAVYLQDFPEGKCMRMTENEKVEDISVKCTSHPYLFLELNIRKNWNFNLGELEKHTKL